MKRVALLVALLSCLVAFTSSAGRADPVICSATLAAGGNVATFFNALPDGSIGCLRGGTYVGNPVLTNSGTSSARNTLRSYPGETAILSAVVRPSCSNSLQSSASYVTLTDLTLQGSNGCDSSTDLYLSGSVHHVEVVGNHFNGSDNQCIFADANTHDNLVARNRLHACGNTNVTTGEQADHAIYMEGSNNKILRNLVYSNYNGHAVQIYPSSSGAHVAGNVVVDNVCPAPGQPEPCPNSADEKSSGILVGASGVTNTHVVNNIVAWNEDGIHGYGNVGATNEAHSNVVYGNTLNLRNDGSFTFGTNIIADPMFVNYPTDLHLALGSPALETADAGFAYWPDFDGVTVANGLPDIGAYER